MNQADNSPSNGSSPSNPVRETLTLRDRVQRLRLNPEPGAKGSSRAWLPWTLCAVLGLTSLSLGGRLTSFQSKSADLPKPETATTDAVASSGEVALESKGYIIPAHQIQVGPKVSGMVVKLYIEEGKRVKVNEVLAELEDDNYLFAKKSAQARWESAAQRLLELKNGNRPEEIDSAKAALDEARAQRDQLYLDWKRNVNLKTGQALAARDYEVAESSYKAMARHMDKLQRDYDLMVKGPRKERIDAAEADVRQAKADLDNANWNLGNCKVKAPVSGTILTKKAEKGNIVNPIAFNISTSLCEMADLSDLEVDLSIQERDIALVSQGQKCRVRPEAYKDRMYEGVVSRLMPIADRAKGAIPVRVKLTVPAEEEGVYLKPDMGVIVSFLKK